MKYKFGSKAKDKITGLVGVLTGHVTYITGCNQYLLSPKVDKEGKHVEPRWFDESRIEIISEKTIVLNEENVKEKPGACEAAPVK